MVIALQPEGDYSLTTVMPRGMASVLLCEYLPDGTLLAIGLDFKIGHRDLEYLMDENDEWNHEETKAKFEPGHLVATIIESGSSRNRDEVRLNSSWPIFPRLREFLPHFWGGRRGETLSGGDIDLRVAQVKVEYLELWISNRSDDGKKEPDKTVRIRFAKQGRRGWKFLKPSEMEMSVTEAAGDLIGDWIVGWRTRDDSWQRNDYVRKLTKIDGTKTFELEEKLQPFLAPASTFENDSHFIAARYDGEPYYGNPVGLAVLSFSNELTPINLDWPQGFRRNGHAGVAGAIATLHEKDTYAVMFEGRRFINVVRGGEHLDLMLNFGMVNGGPAQLRWAGEGEGRYSKPSVFVGSDSPSIWLGFNKDGSRLLTLSYLPYFSEKLRPGYYRPKEEIESSFRFVAKSWDIDGRVAEIARTKLRLEGKWKAESEREKRTKALSSAGLPIHVAGLISRHGLSDREGISIFNRLREGGVPSEGSTDNDPLKLIDELVFSRRVSAEDGRFLVENRNHVDLVTAVADGSRTLEWARWLLLDRGFSDHPEATSRVIAGADVETVALVEEITSAPREGAAKQTEPAETEESKEVAQDESTADTESRKPFWRRKSRFA